MAASHPAPPSCRGKTNPVPQAPSSPVGRVTAPWPAGGRQRRGTGGDPFRPKFSAEPPSHLLPAPAALGSLCSPQSCGWMDRTRGDRRGVPRDAEGKVEGEITSNLTHNMKSATGRTVVCLPEERGRELTFCVCLLFVFKLH